jgi:predicted metal-dependent hydrolase
VQKTLFIDSIGSIEVRKSKRNKRIILRCLEGGKLRVSAPFLVRDKQILKFVQQNQGWIEEQQQKSNKGFSSKLVEESCLKFEDLVIYLVVGSPKKVSVSEAIWTITIPEVNDDLTELKATIETILVKAAKAKLPQRLFEISNDCSLPYTSLKINRAKTRWGSCSSKDNINLSCYIMCLPKHLQDYILIHELCHTIHKNHSANFWNLVLQFVPNLQLVKQELSQVRYHL